MSSRSAAAVAMFAALIAAVGFVFASVPNLELLTLVTFVAGAVTGARRGATAGGIGMALYSSLNPYGIAPPPVFVTQLAGAALFGAAGGWMAFRLRPAAESLPRRALRLGAAGLVLTLVYDGLTNYGTAVSIGAARAPWPVVAAGLVFGAVHLVTNTILFATLGPPLLRVADRVRGRAS
jgi:uncharacterized membrane protein